MKQNINRLASPGPCYARRDVYWRFRCAYHRRLVAHLQEREKELWKWFASSERRADEAESLRLELLKSTYRLEADGHPALFQVVRELHSLLKISGTVSIYQMQIGEGFNASLSFLPGEAHVVLAGPVLTLLSAEELRALLAHELAHYLFHSGWDRKFLVASDVVRGLANDMATGPECIETARLWNLYTELFCDRWALAATGDLGAAVRTLVKAQTGLADANAERYLRQAADIFRAGPIKAGQFTHPELYIRARALELWHNQGEAAESEIERLIQGRSTCNCIPVGDVHALPAEDPWSQKGAHECRHIHGSQRKLESEAEPRSWKSTAPLAPGARPGLPLEWSSTKNVA